MGKGQSKVADQQQQVDVATPNIEEQKKSELLNANDLKKGMTFVATRGRSTDAVSAADFAFLFDLKAHAFGLLEQNDTFKGMLDSDAASLSEAELLKRFDMDGDGKITPKDFEILFQKNMSYIDSHEEFLNHNLPFMGQCAFGVVTGFGIGSLARSMSAYKVPIVLAGAVAYQAAQYLAQQNYINQQVMQAALERSLKEMGDFNGDGVVNRKDVEDYMDAKMKIVTTKLGPGGFAPGLAGYMTFALGLFRGLRRW